MDTFSPSGPEYQSWQQLPAIATGFVAGANTLDFVTDDPAGDPASDPSGLRVELHGTAVEDPPDATVIQGLAFVAVEDIGFGGPARTSNDALRTSPSGSMEVGAHQQPVRAVVASGQPRHVVGPFAQEEADVVGRDGEVDLRVLDQDKRDADHLASGIGHRAAFVAGVRLAVVGDDTDLERSLAR